MFSRFNKSPQLYNIGKQQGHGKAHCIDFEAKWGFFKGASANPPATLIIKFDPAKHLGLFLL